MNFSSAENKNAGSLGSAVDKSQTGTVDWMIHRGWPEIGHDSSLKLSLRIAPDYDKIWKFIKYPPVCQGMGRKKQMTDSAETKEKIEKLKAVPELTPMMRKYLDTKEEYIDCILFYRLGDFYEMFFGDARIVSRELELTLTGKSCGLPERAPMCGVPFHAADNYINRLVEKGYKVAVCEQTEDPKTAKGLVRREVIRVVTPGTNLDEGALDETKNNYILSIVCTEDSFGISAADISTGDFYLTEVDSGRKLQDEISRYMPAEIICNDAFLISGTDIEELKERTGAPVYPMEPAYFEEEAVCKALTEHFHVSAVEDLGLEGYENGVTAAGVLLEYLAETQKRDLAQLSSIEPYRTNRFMVLDSTARRNLELTETMREKQKKGSLLWVLDRTETAMGARMLRSFIEQPLIEKEEIEDRLDAVEELGNSMITREEIREYLNSIYDLERLISRAVYQSANPRDLTAFRNSLEMLPYIKELLKEFKSPLLMSIQEDLDPLADLRDLIERSIQEDPPISVRDGDIIQEGFHEEVDRLRSAKTEGKNWLAQMEQEEREKTGIKNLRIRFNKVFGYCLEVTNSYKGMVPDRYIRKQTLANAERYVTPELKELEDTILGAEEKLKVLEYDLFCEVRGEIADEVVRIQKTAKAVAYLDVLCSFSNAAEQNHYCRPRINEKGIIEIRNGRHPVVEQMMGNDGFIANDTHLDNGKNRIAVITGPNMAGKSTYMRQNALIVLMAQIGSFVPADEADIGIVDRIFTRVGASDDLASGQSTFMVEMTEVANILKYATRSSLLILDEIGRGTSTIDGLSIARAVLEYISSPKTLGAKTLFATHYHELSELEGKLGSVKNYCIAVREHGDDIVFLRKIIPGGADKSYGIQVAKLAGVPDRVISRAKEICAEIEEEDRRKEELLAESSENPEGGAEPETVQVEQGQLSLFDRTENDEVIDEIRKMDLSNMTPMNALNTLYELQTKLKSR